MEEYDVIKKIRKSWRKLSRIFRKKEYYSNIFFTNELVYRYADVHRELQATIAIVSNYREGVDVKSPDFDVRGIYKAEGGVKVDGKDIVIKRYDGKIRCYNDWNEKEKETSETVKNVIQEILCIENPDNLPVKDILVKYAEKNTNIPRDTLLEKINKFVGHMFVGDSLDRLFTAR